MSELFNFFAFEEGVNEDPLIDLKKNSAKAQAKDRPPKKKKTRQKKIEQPIPQTISSFAQENDFGNIEYKWKLATPSTERLEELITQMKFRLSEGKGRAFYMIGIQDDGTPTGLSPEDLDSSLQTLERMAEEVKAKLVIVKRGKGISGEIAEVMVSKTVREDVILDVRVILMGNQNAGKSTLIGVLTGGKLDSGRGTARLDVFKHRHEVLLGRTTSISQHILGFDGNGNITNHSLLGHHNTVDHILDQSSKIITFIDLAGSEKYAKSVIIGLCSQFPDYAVIVIDACTGLDEISRTHMQLAYGLQLPTSIIINKVDKATPTQLKETIDSVNQELITYNRIQLIMDNEEDVIKFSPMFLHERITPVFPISCVTGEKLELLRSFLNVLPIREEWDNLNSEAEFSIEKSIKKEGLGLIVGGVVIRGTVNNGQRMLIGPNNDGGFQSVIIRSIHCKHVAVRSVKAGQFCSFSLSKDINTRRGMVILDQDTQPCAAWEFECSIRAVDSITEIRTFKVNYQPLIHTETIRQCAALVLGDSDKETEELTRLKIPPETEVVLHLRFLYHPEYLMQGTKLMIRDTFMTAVGEITKVYYLS
jgi:GTPase